MNIKYKNLVLSALLFASAVILAAVEASFPPVFPAFPGIKLGLANIAVMYALFFINKKYAFAIAFLKSFFVLATKGPVAGAVSLSGGLASLIVMIILAAVFKKSISYTIASVFGAIFHNIGQLAAASVILRSGLSLLAYLPVLIIAGLAAGIVTSVLLRLAMPVLERLYPKNEYKNGRC
jgi:heptaprenyl diphosphate synthase